MMCEVSACLWSWRLCKVSIHDITPPIGSVVPTVLVCMGLYAPVGVHPGLVSMVGPQSLLGSSGLFLLEQFPLSL